MQTSGFFDAMDLGNGQYDREYVAAQFAKYFSLFVGNGVFLQTANALQVVSAGDMNIIMHAGAAFANGYWYLNDSDLMYTIPINTESTARYDSIVIAFDTVERTAEMRYKVNDISVDRQDELYELQIAQVVVNAGTVEITDAYIIDKRPDESVCGFVKGLVEVLTTNELFNQFNAQFEEWFDVIKGQLSEDAAGNLQLQVDERVLKSNVVKTAEEIENGTDEEKVAGILAIKGLLQNINNSINGRVLKSKVLSQLASVINATSEEEVAGALAVKDLNSEVAVISQNMGGLRFYENSTGKYVVGADSVPKKLGSAKLPSGVTLVEGAEYRGTVTCSTYFIEGTEKVKITTSCVNEEEKYKGQPASAPVSVTIYDADGNKLESKSITINKTVTYTLNWSKYGCDFVMMRVFVDWSSVTYFTSKASIVTM